MVVQLVGGYISGSLAIFADSAHLAADLLGFFIAILGIKFATKKATESYSYGWHRAELVGTLVSIASIWITTVWLLFEATKRVITPNEEIMGGLMFIVAVAGLIFNIIQILILHSGEGHYHPREGGHSHSHGDDGHSHGSSKKPAADNEKPLLENHEEEHAHGQDADESQRNMNVRAAFLHVLGDLLSSCGVVIAAIVIYI